MGVPISPRWVMDLGRARDRNEENRVTLDGRPIERELIQRVQDGDHSAWPALLRPHEPLLRARIRHLIGGRLRRRVSISDILQETLITAHERVSDFDPRSENSLRNWLIAIADRKARRAMQRHVDVSMRSIRRELTRGQRAATHQFRDRAPTPSAVVAADEAKSLARRALAELSEADQQVLRLCREEGLRFPAAAERMGRSYEATKKLYGRALARFSTVLVEIRRASRER
jgi:RNA polymerase sigma-70 factor (ECF subfamily)